MRAVWVYIAGRRILPLQFEFRRALLVAAVTAAAMAVRLLLPPLPLPLSIASGVAILGIYGAVMIAFVLRPAERDALRNVVRRVLPSRAPRGV